jgi:ABC-type bacteriocin/lantibiotic exporter with double-glycine peptidase domain
MKLLIAQVKQSLSYLDRRDKTRLLIAIFAQIILALLDMAGAAGLGIIGVIAALSITNASPSSSVIRIEELLGITNYPPSKQITILCTAVILLFTLKTVGSLYLNRKVLNFLADKQVRIARETWKKILNGDYLKIAGYSRQELVQAVTDSLNVSIIGILGNFMLAMSEIILLLFLFALLGATYPSMAFLTLLAFGTLAYLTQNIIGKKTREMNAEYSRAAVASKTVLMDSLSVLPEIKVSGRLSFFTNKFTVERANAAEAYVKSLWFGQVPKYLFEIGLVLLGVFIFLYTQATSTSTEAIGRIIIFLAVTGRLMPSVMRLQSELIGMHANVGTSQSINDLLNNLNMRNTKQFNDSPIELETFLQGKLKTSTEIRFREVVFSYEEGGQQFNFGDLHIGPGQSVAVVGKSGVGKTTFVQLILGLIDPSKGSITHNNKSPNDSMRLSPGSVSYLSQTVALVSGDIAGNIALGVPSEMIDKENLLLSLKVAALDDWVESLPLGLKTNVGEKGFNFSGGQLQRIGIARAVYSSPSLIVLDEPTSSLDQETENAFLKMLRLLHGQTTFVMITHKNDTFNYVNEVILLEENANVVTARMMDTASFLSLKRQITNEE